MQTNWLIVADEAVAHVYEWQGAKTQLKEVETLTHPAAHAREAEMRHDAHGRFGQGRKAGHIRGGPTSVSASAGMDHEHREGVEFAAHLSQWLAEAQREGRYQHLKVAAAPKFLGMLRKELSPQVAAVVLDELPKDLVHESRADLERRFLGEEKS